MTTIYDDGLKLMEHFNKMPGKLPFIGKHWDRQVERILFVAESHYVNESDFVCQTRTQNLTKENSDQFYQIESAELTEAFKTYFNTRGIINDVNIGKNLKGKNIYTNLKKVLTEYAALPTDSEIFNYFSICNFFQRPSYDASGTIKNTQLDDKIAFETLLYLSELINPTIIFFISAKAYDTFLKFNHGVLPGQLKLLKVYCAPHPARGWWNKPSARYNNMSGKEFVKYILSTKEKIIQ